MSSDPKCARARARRARLASPAALAVALLAACAGPAATGRRESAPPKLTPPPEFRTLEHEILVELNRVRSNPARYAAIIERWLPHYRGTLFRRPGDPLPTRTLEGAAAAREAIAALGATSPVPVLTWSRGMTLGARDHVADLGPRGGMEHVGGDGSLPSHRVNRYGQWHRRISENITFGPATGRDVVAALLIDDGIPDRGHRKNSLDAAVNVAGVACGPHKSYRVMCVVVHAAGYSERSTTAGKQ